MHNGVCIHFKISKILVQKLTSHNFCKKCILRKLGIFPYLKLWHFGTKIYDFFQFFDAKFAYVTLFVKFGQLSKNI